MPHVAVRRSRADRGALGCAGTCLDGPYQHAQQPSEAQTEALHSRAVNDRLAAHTPNETTMRLLPRLSASALLLALSVGSAACDPSKRSDVAGLLPGVEPFGELANVRLRMTAEELRELRPGIREAPYFGLEDSVGGHLVLFHFPKNVSDVVETPKNDRLALVSAGRTFSSDAEGNTAYGRAVRQVRATLGNPSECFNIVPGRGTGHYARWAVDGVHVYVHYYAADAPPGSEIAGAAPARVSTVVSRDPPTIVKRLSREPEPCPTTQP